MLLCLAAHSTHGDLFLRHRQTGSSSESCSKLEDKECSFQERESLGSLGICSCFRATIFQGTIPSSQISYYTVKKGLRMCRQLVSLGDNSILGKHPVSISSGEKFQTPHMMIPWWTSFHPFSFLPPAFPCWPTREFLKGLTHCCAEITGTHWWVSQMEIIGWFRVSLYVRLYEGHMSSPCGS